MTNESKDRLARELAAFIDPDQPPGLAATVLANAVLDLVEHRDGKACVYIAADIGDLEARHPREDEPEGGA
jgi:hypothetical protein